MVEVGITLGANAKAGMDYVGFSKYLFSAIFSLFTDVADTPGKRVEIIINSGPGGVKSSMLE